MTPPNDPRISKALAGAALTATLAFGGPLTVYAGAMSEGSVASCATQTESEKDLVTLVASVKKWKVILR